MMIEFSSVETLLKCTILMCIFPVYANNELGDGDGKIPSWQRIPALSIAEQIGGGAKRVTYYLTTLLDSCQNVEDLNGWILFMDDYLSCDAQAELMAREREGEKSSSSLTMSMSEEQHLERLSEFCAAWDGRAGTNALRLADAHMGFICRNKIHYLQNSVSINSKVGEIFEAENRPLTCFPELEGIVSQCIKQGIMRTLTFCQQFLLAQECLLKTFQQCRDANDKSFLQMMLHKLQIDLKC